MNKKLFIVLILFSTSFAFATNKGYYRQHQKIANAFNYSLTDITIRNNSSGLIYVSVPGSTVNFIIYPNNIDHIYSDDYDGLRLRLGDLFNEAFFDREVCRYALVDVYGPPGLYQVYIDTSSC